MDRRGFIIGVAALIAEPKGSEAQLQPGKIPKVGFLHSAFPPPGPPVVSFGAFREGLRDVGYVEGRTISLEFRWARGKPEALPGLAAELVRLPVDVLVAVARPALSAARDATRTIPIVGADLETDPVASGFVTSLARPGGNITGLFLDLPDLTGKWLELIREAAPGIRRVAVLWDSTTGPYQLRAIKDAARALAMELDVFELRGAAEYDDTLKRAMKGRPHALVLLSSPVLFQTAKQAAEVAAQNRVPAISMFRFFPEAGGLMAYGPSLPDYFRRAATYIDKILKGAKPADLPIEQPTKFELVINLKTAKALGLTIPQSLLLRADQVIE